jgi:hypothetical protein
MPTAKEDVQRILVELPENATYEDIQYHIYVRQKIERAIREVSRGKTLSTREVEKRMGRWLRP